ncbi:hypothetical protein [Sulfurospirillum multivorans]|uniref:Uncharacterized protein n=2 Tax=Sulfurospirillum multivorans TaxID=66821 RepID=A0AA86AMJ2_SULMK|nr:hypothetical protein [Sulfurospirillum multivorans]AHJ12994.1 hypothetical protein SMUL_1739 [Sulfurospirillum multivorans DSM 12446]QEH06484.1 hypothetical protein SMN_1719 [Sulfurospirillum multivorans]
MKKIHSSAKYKHFLKKRHEYQLKRKQYPRYFMSHKHTQYNGAIQPGDTPFSIDAPTIFSIINNQIEMLNFFKDIKRNMNENCNLFIDMERVTLVTTDAIIYMLLFFDNLKEIYPNFKLNGNFPKDEKSKILLFHSGFLEKVFKTKNPYDQIKHKAILKIETGTDTNATLAGDIITFALNSLNEAPSYSSRRSYRNIIEAMSNTNNHAYEKNEKVKKWYLMALYDEESNKVSFSFLDSGHGIISTVKKKNFEKLGLISHISILESVLNAETHNNRSQTELIQRGKGLPSIYASFKSGYTDNLVIISNKAFLDAKNNQRIKLKHSFDGTLISWDFIQGGEKNETN